MKKEKRSAPEVIDWYARGRSLAEDDNARGVPSTPAYAAERIGAALFRWWIEDARASASVAPQPARLRERGAILLEQFRAYQDAHVLEVGIGYAMARGNDPILPAAPANDEASLACALAALRGVADEREQLRSMVANVNEHARRGR